MPVFIWGVFWGNSKRADKTGPHRRIYDINRKRVLLSQDICGICGKLVDKSLPFSHPMSACVDHIIPIAKGGHPSDIENLQLAHRWCNRQKSDKLVNIVFVNSDTVTADNSDLPLSADWTKA